MRRRDDGWFAAYRAVEHVHALLSETPQQISRRGVAYAIYRQCDGRFASLRCNPLGEIRSIDKYDVAADGKDAANAFRSHHAWEFRPITVAARNHQEVAHIDWRGFERDDHFALCRRADIGNIDHFHDLGRIAERFNLDCLHDRFLLVIYYIVNNRSLSSS